MSQKLAKKKAGEQRFSNGRVGIRSAPSHVKAKRSDPKSRPRVSKMERPGASSRNNERRQRQALYTSANSTCTSFGEAKLRLKVAQDLKLVGGSVNSEVSDASPDIERGYGIKAEHATNSTSGGDRIQQLRSKSFGSNFSDFDPISAIRSKMSNVRGQLRSIDVVEDNDDDVDSDDNSLRERYSLVEPVFSTTQLRTPKHQPLRTPKPQPLPPATKIRPSSSSRDRARQCAVFDAMSSEESRHSRDDEPTKQQSDQERHFFADAQIPVLSEDASSNFDTVYTAKSAREDGRRLPATGPPSPMNRRQVSFDASVMFSPSKGEKQKCGGRCRCD